MYRISQFARFGTLCIGAQEISKVDIHRELFFIRACAMYPAYAGGNRAVARES